MCSPSNILCRTPSSTPFKNSRKHSINPFLINEESSKLKHQLEESQREYEELKIEYKQYKDEQEAKLMELQFQFEGVIEQLEQFEDYSKKMQEFESQMQSIQENQNQSSSIELINTISQVRNNLFFLF